MVEMMNFITQICISEKTGIKIKTLIYNSQDNIRKVDRDLNGKSHHFNHNRHRQGFRAQDETSTLLDIVFQTVKNLFFSLIIVILLTYLFKPLHQFIY